VKKEGKKVAELLEKLGQIAESALPFLWKLKLAWHFGHSDWRELDEAFDLSQIPLFGFLFKLLRTYIAANDNLVSECF